MSDDNQQFQTEPENALTEVNNVETLAEEVEVDTPGAKNWIGEERIKSANEDGKDTIVMLKDGRSYRWPTMVFNKMATEKANAGAGRDPELYKLSVIAEDIIGLLEKVYDLKHSEVNLLVQFIDNGVKNDMSYAVRCMFGKSTNQVKLAEIKQVLKDNAEKLANIKEEASRENDIRRQLQR